jgi:2-methylcitrate dehydratase PrpD
MTALAEALAQSKESSVIAGGQLSLAGATLLNGYLITAVTMCDAHRPTMAHVTPEVVPPALAIAERDNLSGCDLLVALAAGCEVLTRIGIALDYAAFRPRGWHAPGVLGPSARPPPSAACVTSNPKPWRGHLVSPAAAAAPMPPGAHRQ